MKTKRNYKAWIACLACMLTFMCTAGMVTSSFSRFLPFIRSDIGLTNTETEAIMFVRPLVTMLTMVVVGKFYERVSLRVGMTLSLVLLMFSCIVFAHAHSVYPCILASVLMGISYAVGGVFAISRILANWFASGRSTVLSLVVCGSGIASIFMPHIIAGSRARWEVKGAFYVEAAIILAVAVIVFLILRDEPDDPQTERFALSVGKRQARPPLHAQLNRREKWILLTAAFLLGAGGINTLNNQPLLFSTIHVPEARITMAVSIIGASMIIGKLANGVITDAIGTYKSNYLFYAMLLAGFTIDTFMKNGQTLLPLCTAFLCGCGASLITISLISWAGDLSRPEDYSEMVRVTQLSCNTGNVAFALIPGIIADLTGSYHISFGISAVLIFVSFIAVQFVYLHKKSPVKPENTGNCELTNKH